MFRCLSYYLNEIHFDALDKTSFSSELHVSFLKARDALCVHVMTDCFEDFVMGKFEFSYLWFYKA